VPPESPGASKSPGRQLRRRPAATCAGAVEGPFFITYTHQMEEPGNLEIATKTVTGQPAGGNQFLGASTELEYGVKAWWTSEWYFDGQATSNQSILFTLAVLRGLPQPNYPAGEVCLNPHRASPRLGRLQSSFT
jgi:hypothetical protein